MKKLLKANSLYLGISLLSSSSAILLIPLYLSYFSVAAYGELALMNTTFSLLAVILTLSIESAFQTFYFDYEGNELSAYFKSIYCFAIIMAASLTGIFALIGPSVFNLIFSSGSIDFYPNGMLITLSVALTLLNQIYFVKLRNQEKIKSFGKFVAINTITSLLLQILFIVVLERGITGAILGALLGNLTVFITTLKHTGVANFGIRMDLIRKSLRYCLWLIPFFLVNWFMAKGDRFIVEGFLGLEEVGIYALLMNISMVISILTTSMLNSIRPGLFTELKKSNGRVNRHVLNTGLYFLSIILLASLILYFAVQQLDHFKLFENYLKVQDYILLALALFVLRGFIRFVSEYFSFLKKSKDMFIVSIINLLIFTLLLGHFASKLDLKLLLIMLVLSNAGALLSSTGRCYYLLKKGSRA